MLKGNHGKMVGLTSAEIHLTDLELVVNSDSRPIDPMLPLLANRLSV
jgi:hypothetical protein